MKIIVAGGSGYLGSRICVHLVRQGCEVVALSRNGRKQQQAQNQNESALDKVSWVKADIFKPETYAEQFKGAYGVIHSMGILLESDYKSLKSGEGGLLYGVKAYTSAIKRSWFPPNPLEDETQILTYEKMNRDSGIMRINLTT